MIPTYQRTLARTLSEYLPIAEEVETFCAQHQLPAGSQAKLRMVLEELVLNLIDHAKGPGEGRIDLRIELEANRVVIVVEDDAEPFDPRSAPAFDKTTPLEQRRSRGMGLQIVRSVTEGMEYDRIGSRNRLRVVIPR